MKKLLVVVFLFLALSFAETDLQISPKIIKQGDSFTIDIQTTETFTKSKIFFNKKNYSFYKLAPNKYQIILGTDYRTKAKNYPLYIKLYNGEKIIYQTKENIIVKKKDFRISTLTISKKRKSATDWKALGKENAIFGKAFRKKTKTKYLKGKLAIPCKYIRISSEYGVQRKYMMEGKEISRWGHKGIDFSNVPGVPIVAVADGKVVVSKVMKVHGKSVIIDHGQGILSTYNHMSQRFVKPGEMVKKGQVIGRIGMTGLITGAHLHFGLSVNNVRVDPEEWFEKKIR